MRFLSHLFLLANVSVIAGAEPATKLAVPGLESQIKSERLVADIFKEEYASANTSDEKLLLARQLIRLADTTKGY